MDNNLSIALNQNLVTIILAILTIYLTLKITKKYLSDKYKISIDNISYSIILSGMLLSSANLITGISTPILNTFSFLKMSKESILSLYLEMIKYIGIFTVLTFITSVLIILISFFLINSFHKETSIKIELEKNNIAFGIITAIIIVSLSLMMKENFILLIESFIPYPTSVNLY